MTRVIRTQRLMLVPATVALTQAALDGPAELGAALGASVSPAWPPEYLDAPALEFMKARLLQGAGQEEWWLYFVVLPSPEGSTVIGTAGYKGPPSEGGTVEVGYGLVADHHRRGYATEAVRALLARAFSLPRIGRVIAETLPELISSIGVLEKCGFRLTGEGSEPGVIRYELTRDEFVAATR